MPPASSIRDFIKALQERKSQIAHKLDACAKDANCRNEQLETIKNWDPATSPPASLVNALGLNPKEVQHIDRWPTGEKQSVKTAVVTAIENNRQVEFFWDVYDGPTSVSKVDNLAGPGDVTVTFLSPRANVRTAGPTVGQIEVDI